MSFCRRTVLSFAIVTAISAGQEPNLVGPVTGLLVDEQTRSIRPILGIPGSADAGEASVTAFDFAAVSPDSHNALVSRAGALYLVRRLDGAMPIWRELTTEPAEFGRAAWSENSDSFAAVNTTTNRLDLWTNLSADPKLAASLDLTSLTEHVVSVAVDKDARQAFAATQGAEGGTLYLLQSGEEPRMILPLSRAGGLLLTAGVLYVTDRGGNEVLRVTNWTSSLEIAAVASAGHGVNDPVGAALSADRKTLYVASAGVNQVLGFDLASSAVKATFDLDFQPTRLERLGSGNLWLLEKGTAGESPAQVLDSDARRVFFIPVSAGAGG